MVWDRHCVRVVVQGCLFIIGVSDAAPFLDILRKYVVCDQVNCGRKKRIHGMRMRFRDSRTMRDFFDIFKRLFGLSEVIHRVEVAKYGAHAREKPFGGRTPFGSGGSGSCPGSAPSSNLAKIRDVH